MEDLIALAESRMGKLENRAIAVQYQRLLLHLSTVRKNPRYAFIFGDFRRIHRSGIIACHYRAAEWRHKEIELAAHDLLQLIDEVAPGGPRKRTRSN